MIASPMIPFNHFSYPIELTTDFGEPIGALLCLAMQFPWLLLGHQDDDWKHAITKRLNAGYVVGNFDSVVMCLGQTG